MPCSFQGGPFILRSWLCSLSDRLEPLAMLPDCPGDSSEFVSQGDGGFVMARALLKAERPAAQPVLLLRFLAMPENGAGTMNEEHAHVQVTSLGDVSQSTFRAAGAFARGEPEIAGEVPGRGEPVDVADEGD